MEERLRRELEELEGVNAKLAEENKELRDSVQASKAAIVIPAQVGSLADEQQGWALGFDVCPLLKICPLRSRSGPLSGALPADLKACPTCRWCSRSLDSAQTSGRESMT